MTFVDPPYSPEAPGWTFVEYFKGYFATITISPERTMKLAFAPGETGRDSGLTASDSAIQTLTYEVYFSGTGGQNVRVPGGKQIPATIIRSPGWNQVQVGSRFVVNGQDLGTGNPNDITCYVVANPTQAPAYVFLDYFEVDRTGSSGSGATDLANANGILQVVHGGTGVTSKTGNGSVVLNVAPILKSVTIDSVLGNLQVENTITAQHIIANLNSATGIPLGNTTGVLPIHRGGTGTTSATGTGNLVLHNTPTLINPTVIGSLQADLLVGNGSGITNILVENTQGILPISKGGTGTTTYTGTGSLVLNTSPVFRGTVYAANVETSRVSGNGYGLYDLNIANVAGVLPPDRGGTGTSTSTGTGSLVLSNSPSLSGQVVVNGTVIANTLQGQLNASLLTGTIANQLFPNTITIEGNIASSNGFLLGNGVFLQGVATTNASTLTSGTLRNSIMPSNISVTSIVANGFGLSSLNAANLTGTIDTLRLPNTVTVSNIVANGFGLSSLNAANLSGTIDTQRLPNTVVVSNIVANGFGLSSLNAANLSGTIDTLRLPSNVTVSNIVANGFGLSSLNAANLSGTIDTQRLPNTVTVSNIVANGFGLSSLNAANLRGTIDTLRLPNTVQVSNIVANGFGLSSLNAANLSGTIDTSRLPNTVQVSNIVANGFGLSSLNAANLSGTIDTQRLPNTVTVSNIVANGFGLSSVNAANLVGVVDKTNLPEDIIFSTIGGDAAGVSNIPGANVVGTLNNSVLPANISTDGVEALFLFGNGSYLTGIQGSASDASALVVGTLDNARLPSSIVVDSITANGFSLSQLNAANLVGQIANTVFTDDITISNTVYTQQLVANSITANGYNVTDINAANLVGQVANTVFTDDITIANTVYATYFQGSGLFLQDVATANAASLVEGTLDNTRLPDTIQVSNIVANGFALHDLNASNLVGTLANTLLPEDVLVQNTITASYFVGNGSLMEGVATINAATLSEGTLDNARLPTTIDVGAVQANFIGNAAGLYDIPTANLVGTLPNASIPTNLSTENITSESVISNVISANTFTGNGYGLSDVYAGNIIGLDILTSNASLLTTGVVDQSILPQDLGNALTMLYGNGVAISNTNAANLSGSFTLDITFPPGSIDANALTGTIDTSLIPSFLPGILKNTFISNQQAISEVVLVANNLVTATTESTRVFLNGLKLASIDANATDYTVSYTQDLANTTTTFTVQFTNPVGYGDVLDVIIETNTSVNANGDSEYYGTVYANTLEVNDIYFGGNSVISNADIDLVLASGIWSGVNGTFSQPSFTFESANSTGLFLVNNALGITVQGAQVATIGNSSVFISPDIYAAGITANSANVLDGNVFVDGEINATGNITAGGSITEFASDARLKSNIQTIQHASNMIKHLHGYTFTWRDDVPGLPMHGGDVGLLAQEVQQLGLDQSVVPAPFDLDHTGRSKSGNEYLTIRYNKLIPLIIEALRETIERLDAISQ